MRGAAASQEHAVDLRHLLRTVIVIMEGRFYMAEGIDLPVARSGNGRAPAVSSLIFVIG